MKTTITSILAVTVLLATAGVRSGAQTERSPRQSMQALKELNQKTIEQQAATLEKLDEMKKESSQLRAFSRRS